MSPAPSWRRRRQLDRLKEEVPIQIEIARRTLASAQAEHAKAVEVQRLTKDEVDRSIDEANAALAAAKADQTLAQIEYDRYTNLFKDDAATKQRRSRRRGPATTRTPRSTWPTPNSPWRRPNAARTTSPSATWRPPSPRRRRRTRMWTWP